MNDQVRSFLEDVAGGRLSVDEALARWRLLALVQLEDFARLDIERTRRAGVPEVVYSPGKTPEQFLAIIQAFVREQGYALASRTDSAGAELVRAWVESEPAGQRPRLWVGTGGALEVLSAEYEPPADGGTVGILVAGTADLGVVEEVELVVRHMGCRTLVAADVGVAGLQRLAAPLQEMLSAGADVLVVAAGMEGALASVVAGLVSLPVIGLPTSVGYGLGGGGQAALLSMLQSCSAGLVVVNIDNGVGAGAAAGLIARRRPLPGAAPGA